MSGLCLPDTPCRTTIAAKGLIRAYKRFSGRHSVIDPNPNPIAQNAAIRAAGPSLALVLSLALATLLATLLALATVLATVLATLLAPTTAPDGQVAFIGTVDCVPA